MMTCMNDTSTPLAVLGRNVAAVRARRDMSQQELSDRMRVLGWPGWFRQVVGKAERGSRQLTVPELIGLAVALETTVTRLLEPQPEDGHVMLRRAWSCPPM